MSEIVKEMFKTVRLVCHGALYLILCVMLFNVQPCHAAGGTSKVVSTVVKDVMNAFKVKPPTRMWKSGDGSRAWNVNPIAVRTAIKQIKEAQQSDDSGNERSNAGDEVARKMSVANHLRQRLKGKSSVEVGGENEPPTVQLGRNAECKNDLRDDKGAGCVVTVIISVLIALGLSCLILRLIIASCSDDDGEPQTI